MKRAAHPFAPPPSPAVHGCLAALVVAGALMLAALGAGGFIAATHALAQGPAASRPARGAAPSAATRIDFAAARRTWGEIRARYRFTDRRVPA